MPNHEKQLEVLEKYDSGFQWAESYGEPGYTNPENAILFANWNNVPKHVGNWFESHGYELEWSDEWVISYEGTSKAYRSQPDSYSWRPYFLLNDWTNGEVIGADEILEDESLQSDYVNEFLLNNSNAADQFGIDLTKHGFKRYNTDRYESGFHPGQDDNPKTILEQAKERNPDSDFVFTIDDKGQFDMSFSLWIRPSDYDSDS